MADKSNPTTELRVMISEGPDGNLLVEHEARIKGTTTIIPMRPSHVAGQLFAAALVMSLKEYGVLDRGKEKKRKGN